MTSTSVVLGIAALGTPEAPPDCDWTTDDAGITVFIGLSFLDSVCSIYEEHEPYSFSWYQLVPHINLDAATYRWFQINSAGRAVVVPLGTILVFAAVRCGTKKLSRRGDG